MYQLRGKLSIVMPAYNEEALIYNSIMQTLSIVEQFAPDMEIIAVNDGSKDKTKQEIERAIRDDAKQPHPVVPGMRLSGTRIKARAMPLFQESVRQRAIILRLWMRI